MPTAHSSTEVRPGRLWPAPEPVGTVAAARRAVTDVRHLLWFRTTATRRPRAAAVAAGVMVGFTLAAALVPAFLEGAGELEGSSRAIEFLVVLPTALAGFLVLAVVSAVASGGGRELLSREQGVAHPVSATTDHLGALLMAPLNIAWLLQAWGLLGVLAYALGPAALPAQILVLLWVAFGTALAQVVAWTMEAVRRSTYGVWIVRGLTAALVGVAALLQLTGRLTSTLDMLPTGRVAYAMVQTSLGDYVTPTVTGLVLAVLTVACVVVGAVPAHLASRRTPREEARIETGIRPPRHTPRTDLGMAIRIDRASIWRAVPMRRGMAVLSLGPGLVALAGDLDWETFTILPGLVASGGALLFGVNIWCLDGRGALWRESLPLRPATVFASRAWTLAEWLLLGAGVTVLLASLRAGRPTSGEAVSLLMAVLVVTLQVVAAAMRWSAKRPFAVDMRSARATPAPPVMMVAYSSRLALSTTMTGMVFSGLARLDVWGLTLLVAVPFLMWSGTRLVLAWTRWLDVHKRAVVVTTVAA